MPAAKAALAAVKLSSCRVTGLLALGFVWFIGASTSAQNLVLDEEFNQFSQQLTAPLRSTLVPGRTVNYVLVNNPAINAFVTGENIVFIHSGLVMQAKTAAELQGVLAHELAHLAAGHLQQRQAQAASALVPMLAGAALGVGAALAGAPQASVALAMGGQAAGIQTLLNYSRIQEQEADQRALEALHAANLSAGGMVGLFNTLRTQSQLSYDMPPPWLVTHPLPAERLARLQAAVQAEQNKATINPNEVNWPRIQAKVAALTLTPTSTQRKYRGNTVPEHYARAIALLKQGKLAESEALLTPLLKAHPTDAYFLEIQGQLALARGDIAAAIVSFRNALQAEPNGLLLRYQLAEALRANNQALASLAHYREIARRWPIWSQPWEGMGRALGQTGDIMGSHLALTEAALADGDLVAAKQSLGLAAHYLKQGQTQENLQNKDENIKWYNILDERLNPKQG